MTRKMTEKRKIVYRYSICFKEKVVQEVSSGSSISEVCRRYGIKGKTTVQRWIKQLGREELLNEIIRVKMRGERDEIKRLEEENKRLKIALGESMLVQHALESLIEVANEHYQTDIKKTSDKSVIFRHKFHSENRMKSLIRKKNLSVCCFKKVVLLQAVISKKFINGKKYL
jgi:transposase-like protein